jgi:osmotically-inducible protein OsmY
MMATSSPTQATQPGCGILGTEDDRLHSAALKVLHSCGYAGLRRLRCEATDAVVIVHGVVPSYYLKQMAQTIVQRLDGIRSVVNLVEVQPRDTKSRS